MVPFCVVICLKYHLIVQYIKIIQLTLTAVGIYNRFVIIEFYKPLKIVCLMTHVSGDHPPDFFVESASDNMGEKIVEVFLA